MCLADKLCEKCGILIRNATGNTRYCEFCKVEVRKKQVKRDVRKHREKKGIEAVREDNRRYYYTYQERWANILRRYRYDAIGKAYEEHGKLMNQYYTGKGTNNFGPHADPDFEKELMYVRREKRRRGI